MIRKLVPAILVVSAVLTAGCTKPVHDSSNGVIDTVPPDSTTTTTSRPCSSFKAGQDAVLQAFCGGHAVVHVLIGKRRTTIDGGVCSDANGMLSVTAGVSVGSTFVGPIPPFFGLVIPATTGVFHDATISVTIGGQTYVIASDTGALDMQARSGAVSGRDSLSSTQVSANFAC